MSLVFLCMDLDGERFGVFRGRGHGLARPVYSWSRWILDFRIQGKAHGGSFAMLCELDHEPCISMYGFGWRPETLRVTKFPGLPLALI